MAEGTRWAIRGDKFRGKKERTFTSKQADSCVCWQQNADIGDWNGVALRGEWLACSTEASAEEACLILLLVQDQTLQ